jgi:hypothetical protein
MAKSQAVELPTEVVEHILDDLHDDRHSLCASTLVDIFPYGEPAPWFVGKLLQVKEFAYTALEDDDQPLSLDALMSIPNLETLAFYTFQLKIPTYLGNGAMANSPHPFRHLRHLRIALQRPEDFFEWLLKVNPTIRLTTLGLRIFSPRVHRGWGSGATLLNAFLKSQGSAMTGFALNILYSEENPIYFEGKICLGHSFQF